MHPGYKTVVTKLSFHTVASRGIKQLGYIVTKISSLFRILQFIYFSLKNKIIYLLFIILHI